MFDFVSQLEFSRPMLIIVGLLPIVLLLTATAISSFTVNNYCDKSLLSWATLDSNDSLTKKLLNGPILPILTWILFSIALAGPRINIEERSLTSTSKSNKAIIFILDLSSSMLTQDIYPDRISKAKLTIEKIATYANGYLFSLIVYSDNAHIAIPLTYDNNVILSTLDSLEPNMLPVAGSVITPSLKLAAQILKESNAEKQAIFIFSDGDSVFNHDENIPELNNVNTVGFGTSEGQAIPNKNGGWLIFDNKAVISRLNRANLESISEQYNGQYVDGNNINIDVIRHLLPTTKSNISHNNQHFIIIWQQVYHWFLLPGLILFLLTTVKYKLKKPNRNVKHALIIPVLLAITLVYPDSSKAAATTEADTFYHNKNFVKSEMAYKKISGYKALMGQANSVYKQKNYQKSLHLYGKAIQLATTDKERSIALFNLANTYYIIGDYSQSILVYKDSLLYNPALKEAKINLKYAIILDKKVKHEISLRSGKLSGIKPGSGPRSVKIEDGVSIGDSKVTLSTDADNKNKIIYNNKHQNELIAKLIKRGIKYSIISSSRIDTTSDNTQWQFEYTTLDMIELLVKEEKMSNYLLWKRLFEIEAGFPAPVETPHIKPGVKPW